MRARLDNMAAGQEFCFLCEEKMAEKMDRLINLAGGELVSREIKSFGVVVNVRKKQMQVIEP